MTYTKLCGALVERAPLFLNKIIILAILFFPLLTNAGNYTSSIISQDQNHIRLKFNFDKPRFEKANGKKYAFYRKAISVVAENGATVPAISELISLAGNQAEAKIISKKQKSIKAANYFIAEDSDKKFSKSVDIKYLGLRRDISVFSLTIMPVSYNKVTKEILWTEELIIEIRNTSSEKEKEVFIKKKGDGEASKSVFINNSQLYEKITPSYTFASSQNNPAISNFSVIYKIKINKTGFYKITYDDLLDVDFPVNEISPKNLVLLNKGSEVPIYLSNKDDNRFDSKDYFEFWAEKNEKTFYNKYDDLYSDPFSDENIYWLVESTKAGRRLVEENGGIIETNPANYRIPYRFLETLHFEEDTRWERFGYDPEFINDVTYKYDHWFWGNPIGAVSSRSFEFKLAHPFEDRAGVFVTAMFRGRSIPNSSTNQIKGHNVAVWLNDEKVGEILPSAGWSGQKKAKISNTSPLSQSNLINGTNELRIDMDQEGVTDIVFFNWFNITYYKKYRAYNNTIKFKLQDDLFAENKIIQFQIDGFTKKNIHIYKLGLSKIINGRVDEYQDDENFSSNRITIQDQIFDPNIEYVAITEDAKLKPAGIEKYLPWKEEQPLKNIIDKENSADLIIVTHRFFLDQAIRLKNIKEEKGFTAEVVTVDQIYDTFNNGIKSPLAIKNFLKYAYFSWNQSKKLKYVILAGDATYDYKGILKISIDYVPTIMFNTEDFGAAAADIQYACLSGDDLIPDISIGRLPASTSTELSDYIDKIEEYEDNTDFSLWRNKALFISGNDEYAREDDTEEPVFRAQNNRMLSLKVPQNIFGYKLNVVKDEILQDDDPNFGGNRDLLDYFDDGLTFLNFFGHGGGAIWSDKNLLSLEGVDNLNNSGKYPFISSMTCYTGAFENPSKEGLAEKLVMTGNKGAIAALASSSQGWVYNDFAIQWPLHDYLWEDDVTFGEAVDNMKIAYIANGIYYTGVSYNKAKGFGSLWPSMVNQYNLLGDPTLKIQKPNAKLDITVSNDTPSSGETLTININVPQSSGIGYVEITDANNWKYLNETFSLSSGTYSFDFNIPTVEDDSLIIDRLFKIKSYVNGGDIGASGSKDFIVEGSLINYISINPEQPDVNNEISFEIIAKSYQPIEHMELRKFRLESGLNTSNVTIVMAQINDSLFRSATNHPGFDKGGNYLYEIYLRDASGKEKRYDLNRIVVTDNRPDLELDVNSIGYSGIDHLQLKFNVQNNSEIMLENVAVNSYAGQDTFPFFSDSYTFPANEKKTFYAPYVMDSLLQSQVFKIEIDPENFFKERNENNNSASRTLLTDHIFVNHNIGSSSDGVTNNSIKILDKWDFYIDKDNISTSTVVSFLDSSINDVIKDSEQKDLKYLPFRNFDDSTALYVNFKNPASDAPATISTYLDSTKDLSNASFYRFDKFLGRWSKIESSGDSLINGKMSSEINQNGLYGLFSSDDDSEPFIEITANGRPLKDNVLVKSDPSIAFLLQDENGIDFRNTFRVILDEKPISTDDLIMPDSVNNANSIAILTTPQLGEGLHTIEVYVSDLNNNESSIYRTFKVSAENKLIVYGNYPNPFEKSTIISYLNDFSNNLSKLKTKIYSVSGHLVRSKKLDAPEERPDYDPTATGYKELVWDGTDDDGNEVANGVYFISIEAEFIEDFSNKKSTFKKVLKVARLR